MSFNLHNGDHITLFIHFPYPAQYTYFLLIRPRQNACYYLALQVCINIVHSITISKLQLPRTTRFGFTVHNLIYSCCNSLLLQLSPGILIVSILRKFLCVVGKMDQVENRKHHAFLDDGSQKLEADHTKG